MESGDVPVVAGIDRVAFPTPWPAAAFLRELRRDRAYYYVLLRPRGEEPPDSDGGWADRLRNLFNLARRSRIIGYVGFRLEGDEGHITTIAVRPDWQGQGFGDLLLVVALEKMLAGGAEVATLEMRPSNDVAYALYQKHGFEVERRRHRYYQDGEDAWVMAAEIDNEAYRRRLARQHRALKERLQREQIEVRQNGNPLL
jgi:ribosomal-protein-alanine N-acetyltransferase